MAFHPDDTQLATQLNADGTRSTFLLTRQYRIGPLAAGWWVFDYWKEPGAQNWTTLIKNMDSGVVLETNQVIRDFVSHRAARSSHEIPP